MNEWREEVRLALANFPDDPQTETRHLRDLSEGAWDSFSAEAEAAIESGEDTAAVRHLIVLFAGRGHLAPYLARLMQNRREIGRRTARFASRIVPALDRELARSILDNQKAGEGSPTRTALLEVLEALAQKDVDGNAQQEPGRNRESEEPGVRSRMAAWVGRAARAQALLKVIREEPDPRIRADAVESLWEHGGAFAAVCFEAALKDPHHRVVANAVLGLYLIGDARSAALLAEMIEHPERAFRAAAVWAMGETRDARFVPLLWKVRRGSDRSMAAQAARSCEAILMAQAAAEREPVTLTFLGARSGAGSVQSDCLAVDQNRDPVRLRETDWRPRTGNQPVWQFSVREVDGLPRFAAIFLLPRSDQVDDSRAGLFAAALREAFRAKRLHDALGIVHYAESPVSGEAASATAESVRPIQLSPDARLAIRSAASPPPPFQLYAGLSSAASASIAALRQFKGARHLIVAAGLPETRLLHAEQVDELSQTALRAGVQCHALCLSGASLELQSPASSLAVSTSGFTLELDSWDSLFATLPLLTVAFTHHYEIQFPDAGEIDRLDVEIASQHHSGRAHCAIGKHRNLSTASPDIHWERESPKTPVAPAPGAGGIPAASSHSAVL